VQQRGDGGHVPRCQRREERLQHDVLLVEAYPRRRVGLRNGATGSRGVLARGGDRAAQHIGDLGERDRERVVQHEGDAPLGREPLQHHESGTG